MQLQGSQDGSTWQNLSSASAIAAVNTTVVLSDSLLGVEALTGFGEGDTIRFKAIITDKAGNSRTGDASATTLMVDQSVPTVSSIDSTTANGSYNEPDQVVIRLNYSKNVTLTGGTLNVTLDTGDVVSIAAFGPAATSSGTYTVGAGDTSADLTVTLLALSAGSMRDAAGNNASLVLPVSDNLADNAAIVIDTTAPGTFTAGTVATTGGTVVAGYWNSTNTGVNVTIPIANDASLNGGTVQLQGSLDGSTWQNLSATTDIAAVNTTVVISDSLLGVEALTGFGDDDTVQFRAIIFDAAGNSRTGAPSATTLTVDTTPPAQIKTSPAASADLGTLGGTIDLSWSNPTLDDRIGILITWEKAAVITGSILLGEEESYTTPVLTNAVEYTFTLKTVDDAGNQSTPVTKTATPAASTLLVTSSSVESALGPILTFATTFTGGTLTKIYYWEGNTTKPVGASSSTDIDGSVDLSLLLGGNKTFGFCLAGTIGATTYESISYVFTWNDTAYDTPSAPISRSLLSPAVGYTVTASSSAVATQSYSSSTAVRRSSSTITPMAVSPLTAPASWLTPSIGSPGAKSLASTASSRAAASTRTEKPQAKSPVMTGRTAATPKVPAKATAMPKDEASSAKSTGRDRQLAKKESTSGISDIAALRLAASYTPVTSSASGGPGAPKAPTAPDRASDRSPLALTATARTDGKRRNDEDDDE